MTEKDGICITLNSISQACQWLIQQDESFMEEVGAADPIIGSIGKSVNAFQEVCDKIYENYATLLQDAVVESKEQVFVNQNPSSAGSEASKSSRSGSQRRRTLLSKETRDFLESVFEKKRSPNSRERKAIAEKCGLTPVQVRVWFTNKRMRSSKNK